MRYLLDTHTFIWFIEGNKSLSRKCYDIIEDSGNKCYVSIATIWEIAIKVSMNKLELKSGFSKIMDFINTLDFEILPIKFEHSQTLIDLEFHHKDPFDRMLISQGICEKFTILTRDEEFKKYKVKVLWD